MGKKYVFQLGAYSPETIPMARLVEYMAQLVRVFGNENGIHFDEVFDGSTKLAVNVDDVVDEPVDKRVHGARAPDAPADLAAGIRKLDELVAEDQTSADLYLAANDGAYLEVVHFGGRPLEQPKTYGPFGQPTSIDAYLRWVGGKPAHAKLLPFEGQKITADCTQELAKELGHHLFEWLRFQGEGKWFRDARGKWDLRVFTVTNFTPIKNESLQDAVERLRAIKGTDWENMADPMAFIRELRQDDDEAR